MANLLFGTGRSSTATFLGPWKTTAFMVAGSSDILAAVSVTV